MSEGQQPEKDNKVSFEAFQAAKSKKIKKAAQEQQTADSALSSEFVKERDDFKVIADESMVLARGRVSRQTAKMKEMLKALEVIGVTLDITVKALPLSDMKVVLGSIRELEECLLVISRTDSLASLRTLQMHFADALGVLNKDLDKKEEILTRPPLSGTLPANLLQRFNGFRDRLNAIKKFAEGTQPQWFPEIEARIIEFQTKIEFLKEIPNIPEFLDISLNLQDRIKALDGRIQNAEEQAEKRASGSKEE